MPIAPASLVSSLLLLAPSFVAQPVGAGDPEALPPEVVAWLESTAVPLASLEPGAEVPGLAALRGIVGDARIVALGEATHGSHEFFAFKARAVEFLVRELGFTDFAMETDWTQALAAAEWVEHGRGDLEGALAGLSSLWRTEEYRELLAWMREWNAGHERKVRFHGLDLAQPGPTARRLQEYLARVDHEVAESVAPIVERLGTGASVDEADLEGLTSLFDELEDAFVERSSAAEWALHRQHVAALAQNQRQRVQRGHDATAFRDRCMADNARWILRQGGPDARLIVSAHNGHVSRAGLTRVEGYGTVESIGRALAADARAAQDEDLSMVVIGSALGSGGFLAYGASGGGLQPFTVGEPLPSGHEVAFLAAKLELALLDLRAAPAGTVRDWLAVERPLRFVGGQFAADWPAQGNDVQPSILPAEFDALFFAARVTPARALH